MRYLFYTPFSQFDPQDDEPAVLIPPSHIEDQLKFCLRMFIRVMAGTLRKIHKRRVGPVIPIQPPVDKSPAGLILNGSLFNAIRFNVLDYSFSETDILCYPI
ncbi:hypothetical protein JS73_08640 [Synergistes jonesii]|uniref:Uncharacterized protein n=1 Tax=Synergistes jonesii TaxID=2754 RepID=A0A073IR83_9BACT|nr:hypothetical protein EH55_06540 [Synergistes jonesii]OFB61978.1 hypothetical protein JS73_08640 [Synergistes jonesii]OFB62583.1 hypothetical protein JS79_09105 [Synergistes jonesii]OFB64272.1 hypothetical protein JS72_04920 [Synergistes jonesii]OFB67419.1 hypothetical protein JS78_08650 [Synergistes jonesii]